MKSLTTILRLSPDGPLLNKGGGSGKSTTVTISSPILNPKPVVMDVDADNIGTTSFGSRKVNFTGTFSDVQKKCAKQAFSLLANKHDNEFYIFHITIKEGSKKSNFVFTVCSHPAAKDGTPGELDFNGVGVPTSTLPDATKIKTIEGRLTKHNIGLTGFGSDESKIVKMGLDALTDDEFDKMKDVRFSRSGAGPQPDVGGQYDQENHTVHIFNFGFDEGDKMALGTAPADLLPSAAHAVIHESAHVIAYHEIHLLDIDFSKKKKAYTDLLLSMEKEYPGHVRVRKDTDGTVVGHDYDGAGAVDASQRSKYIKDTKELDKRFDDANKAQKKIDSKKVSTVMANFTKDTKSEPALTPYSRKETIAAGADADLKHRAKEEVFAEAFSIFKWNKDWLGKHRPKMKSFFDAKKHLK
jgi:hypothetical protein